MNGMRQLIQYIGARGHPWRSAILLGIWIGIVVGVTGLFNTHGAILESAFMGLGAGGFFTLYLRFVWPLLQRQYPGRRASAWDAALFAGVLALLATWNLLIFGFDTSLTIDIVLSIVVGIAAALLVRQLTNT